MNKKGVVDKVPLSNGPVWSFHMMIFVLIRPCGKSHLNVQLGVKGMNLYMAKKLNLKTEQLEMIELTLMA